ncbi:MAG: hypothetical protein WBM09_09360 [Gallionella sp.]
MSKLYPDDDETKKLAKSIRLSGKTIHEWKEDCEIFLADKLCAEENYVRQNSELNTEIGRLEGIIFYLKESIRQMKESSGGDDLQTGENAPIAELRYTESNLPYSDRRRKERRLVSFRQLPS